MFYDKQQALGKCTLYMGGSGLQCEQQWSGSFFSSSLTTQSVLTLALTADKETWISWKQQKSAFIWNDQHIFLLKVN